MAYLFRLPDLGEGIVEAEVVRWLVREGDTVRQDEPLLEVQTDKALVALPSPVAGRVVRLGAAEGERVRVGTVLVELQVDGAPPAAREGPEAGASAGSGEGEPAPGEPLGIVGFFPGGTAPGPRDGEPSEGAPVRALPAARRLARELGVDLASVPGTGPGGAVTEADVRRAAEGRPAPEGEEPAAGPGEVRVPLRGVRRRVAERMVESKFTAPHVTAMDEVDVSELVTLRARVQRQLEGQGIHLTYLPFIIRAVVSGLKAYPYMNASLDASRQELILKKSYHIGIAVATEDGLLVPVVRHADRLSLFDLARQLNRLVTEARARRLSREELRGSTFTISNYGAFGGLFATPIINPPEVAILGVGRIQEKPVARGGRIEIRHMMGLSLSFDHRVVDGDYAGRFMAHVMERLESPGLVALESQDLTGPQP